MLGRLEETRPIFVDESRKKWIEATTQLKPYFIEKVTDCLSQPLTIISKKIPINSYDEEDVTLNEISFSGDIHPKWVLTGGIVYEYIYDVDTMDNNSFFTTTSDIDIPVKIMDIFSDEFNIVDTKKFLTSEFFDDVVFQTIERLNCIDFSDMDYLFDNLPDSDVVDYIDNGKVRIVCAESSNTDNLAMRKTQLFISKDGYYDEIMDIMIYIEVGDNTDKRDQVIKKGTDGIERIIYFNRITTLLNGEFEALIERFVSANVKTENHIGRILYILTRVAYEDDELNKYAVSTLCELFITSICRRRKIKIIDLKEIVLAEYKGKQMKITDIIYPIADYAISKHRARFVMLFPELSTKS